MEGLYETKKTIGSTANHGFAVRRRMSWVHANGTHASVRGTQRCMVLERLSVTSFTGCPGTKLQCRPHTISDSQKPESRHTRFWHIFYYRGDTILMRASRQDVSSGRPSPKPSRGGSSNGAKAPKVSKSKHAPSPAKVSPAPVKPTAQDLKSKTYKGPFAQLLRDFEQGGPSTSKPLQSAPPTYHEHEVIDNAASSTSSTQPSVSRRRAPVSQAATSFHEDAHPSPASSAAYEAAKTPRLKEYAPVMKGDIALPGGPNWSAFRRKFKGRPAAPVPGMPTLDSIVVVEGDTDCFAVHRTINAPVFVVGGSRAKAAWALEDLKMLKQLGRDIIVLTDPDATGRDLRVHLDEMLGPVKHAFIAAENARSTRDNLRHEAGNVGVENAAPDTILHALQRAQPSFGPNRQEFNSEELITHGLMNTFNSVNTKGAKLRRQLFCDALGIDFCTGGALVSTLNRFFSRQQFEDALNQLEGIDS